MRLHVVCFDQPYPPVYGGIIDVFYKIAELHKHGIHIALHVFLYGNSVAQSELENYADEIHYYPLVTGKIQYFSFLPFFIRSRKSDALLRDLLLDSDPILFEGIHTCGWITDPRLKSRLKIVRTHNVERDYYSRLARDAELGKRKLILANEALKLRIMEKYLLSYADRIVTLSEMDNEYFKKLFPSKDVRLANCFFKMPELPLAVGMPIVDGKYILYHGNLGVSENENAVAFIINEIAPCLMTGFQFVVAGRNPSTKLESMISRSGNVQLISNPSMGEMENLVYYAQIHLLLTFQGTGSKLKILNCLASGYGYCIVNDIMLIGNQLMDLCVVANTRSEILNAIKRCYFSRIDNVAEVIKKRQSYLVNLGYNDLSNIIR